jgi:hypothetical protein
VGNDGAGECDQRGVLVAGDRRDAGVQRGGAGHLALVASTLVGGTGPLGLNVPEEIAALVALALVVAVSVGVVRG